MYAKINNTVIEQYPYYIHSLKAENPNTSFPNNIEVNLQVLAEYNIERVFPSTQPEFNPLTQKVVEGVPAIQQDKKWYQTWQVVELTTEEIDTITSSKAAEVRAQRNRLLQESDWTQYKDISEEISVLWQSYRQQLRDITAQPGFPNNIEWPRPPQ